VVGVGEVVGVAEVVGELVGVAVGLGLVVGCGSTKIWTVLPEGLAVFAAGFWLHTVPGGTG